MQHPDKFLSLIFHEIAQSVGDDLALCAGFERGEWRNEQFADHIMEWLPEFALKHSELDEISHHNAIKMVSKAAKLVYQTEKYGIRGEFGEILLHIAIRQVYETVPAITKIYYKSAVNETVKGFDAVHVVRKNNELELWIGEAKFYKDVNSAINEVCKEIIDHLETDYLRNEFLLISNKIDPFWPEAESLKAILNGNVSLDVIFKRACIPFVDMPAIYPSKNTPSSLLIQLAPEDIPESLREKVDKFLNQNKLPVDILRKFSNIEPEYLLVTAEYLLDLDVQKLDQFSWSNRPQYEDIGVTSEIIWDKLGGATSAKHSAITSAKMMTKWIWDLYKTRNIPQFRLKMIKNQIDYNKSPDNAVENVLAFLRGWASFNYPKYLSALNAIANHVLTKRGLKGCNYLVFATLIEYLFQPSSFSTLEEYGLPTEISEKLLAKRLFNEDDDLDVVITALRDHELSNYGDGIFEKRVIEDFKAGIGANNS